MKERILKHAARLCLALPAVAILCTAVYAAVNSDIAARNPKPEETPPIAVCSAVVLSEEQENAVTEETLPEPVSAEITEEVIPPTYTDDDLFCLAAVIYAEAGSDSCSDRLRMAVGNVVLNRTKSKYYPDTVRTVIEQPMQYGWLSRDGIAFPKGANEDAVNRAYDCAKRILEGETILPENVIFQAEFKQGEGVYEEIDGVYFCWKN